MALVRSGAVDVAGLDNLGSHLVQVDTVIDTAAEEKKKERERMNE